MSWDGAFSPYVEKHLLPGETPEEEANEFADKFDVVNVRPLAGLGVVHVVIVFHDKPEKEYTFEIDEDDFRADKQHVADEIKRQMSANENG